MSELKIKPSQAVSVDLDAIKQVLDINDGDAALLYLYFIRNNEINDIPRVLEELCFEEERFSKALLLLAEAGLITGGQTSRESAHTQASVINEASFQSADLKELRLCYEKSAGRLIRKNELSAIRHAYCNLGLPASVIMALINYLHQSENSLTASRLEKEACIWSSKGINCVERVEQYLQSLENITEKTQETAMLLNIYGRNLSPSEKDYINEWLGMGFSPDVIQVAYDKTVIKTGALNWKYLNTILCNWHKDGIHSKQELEKHSLTSGQAPKQVNYSDRPKNYAKPFHSSDTTSNSDYYKKVLAHLKNKHNE